MNTLLPRTAPAATTAADQNELQDEVLHMLEVQQALRARLLHLNFHAFARCMSDLLRELGFDEVRLAGRLDWKGRNKDGGYDLVAYTPERLTALSPDPTPLTYRRGSRNKALVQLMQYGPESIVHQRSVDELRGACLRAGASEGVLITTSGFSQVAQEQAAALARQAAPVAPVHLVDGPALLRALVSHRIGVTDSAPGKSRSALAVDQGYFDALEQDFPGKARRTAKNKAPAEPGRKPDSSGGNGRDTTTGSSISQIPEPDRNGTDGQRCCGITLVLIVPAPPPRDTESRGNAVNSPDR